MSDVIRVSVRVEVEVDPMWAERLDLLARDAANALQPYGSIEHAATVRRKDTPVSDG